MSVAASALASVGVDINLFLPNATFLGQTHLLDTNGNDTFTVFTGQDNTFHDRGGADTIKVQNGARLTIAKDSDPSSGNTVVLQDISHQSATLGVSYTLGVGSVPVYSDDPGVKIDDSTFLGSLSSALLHVDGQYASGGRGVDVIEIRE